MNLQQPSTNSSELYCMKHKMYCLLDYGTESVEIVDMVDNNRLATCFDLEPSVGLLQAFIVVIID